MRQHAVGIVGAFLLLGCGSTHQEILDKYQTQTAAHRAAIEGIARKISAHEAADPDVPPDSRAAAGAPAALPACTPAVAALAPFRVTDDGESGNADVAPYGALPAATPVSSFSLHRDFVTTSFLTFTDPGPKGLAQCCGAKRPQSKLTEAIIRSAPKVRYLVVLGPEVEGKLRVTLADLKDQQLVCGFDVPIQKKRYETKTFVKVETGTARQVGGSFEREDQVGDAYEDNVNALERALEANLKFALPKPF